MGSALTISSSSSLWLACDKLIAKRSEIAPRWEPAPPGAVAFSWRAADERFNVVLWRAAKMDAADLLEEA